MGIVEFRDLTEYELEFSARMLGQVLKVGVQFNHPAAAMIRAAVLAEPLELDARNGAQNISINGALDQFGTKKSAEIIDEIQVGSAIGETSQQIQRRLTSVHQLQSDQASSLVRTMTNHVASQARGEQVKANTDILQGWTPRPRLCAKPEISACTAGTILSRPVIGGVAHRCWRS